MILQVLQRKDVIYKGNHKCILYPTVHSWFLHDLLIVIKLYKPHKKLTIPNRKHIQTMIFSFPLGGRASALTMRQNIPKDTKHS